MDRKGGEDILINTCSPGFVATDMTQHKGHLTLEEGAVTPVYVALLPPNIQEPRGRFIRNKEISQEIQGC
ncbi:carbonyl reductase [NADPH] 1-like [Elysia marginata]|uniref:Carbonyl reductase [NADPH] 1-like n=1 Tax=Elysia marginata TaxID=1093978 RepID=A0AAV4FCD9_9GAST|nr:carbonyl reductase [NADPH] 1-like [Elysia marginata]